MAHHAVWVRARGDDRRALAFGVAMTRDRKIDLALLVLLIVVLIVSAIVTALWRR
jgi:hypothetical protein